MYSSLREDNTALAFEILENVDERLSALLSSRSVSSDEKDLNNWRSAVRKYVDFLQDEIEVIPDEEELEELSAALPKRWRHIAPAWKKWRMVTRLSIHWMNSRKLHIQVKHPKQDEQR